MLALIDSNPKRIIAGEARNALKLDNAPVLENQKSLNQEPHFLVEDLSWQVEENFKSQVEGLRV
jgi:hypothetical protein